MIFTKGMRRRILKTKRLFSFIISFSFLLFVTQLIQAATLSVPSTQYPTVQSAVDAANAGDTIILQAGTTFTEAVVLKYKAGSDYITIQSSALSSLPPDGQRVNPSYAQYMPKIAPPSGGGSAISTEITTNGPTHHYRLLGIEVAQPNVNLVYSLITFGSGDSDQNTLAKVANHFIVDRCYIHGHPDGELRRGITLNSSYTDILNSYIADVHQVGNDTQAIGGWNGPGPYTIKNNHLEGAGENVLFGGSDPWIQNLVPSDIEIRQNYFYKPPAWRNRVPSWSVKNNFELKNARRVLIDGNIFENCWIGGQHGEAVVFTARNQNGTAPWSILEDITFTNNIIKRVYNGFFIRGKDDTYTSQQSKNITIANNLLTEINPEIWCAGEPDCTNSSTGKFFYSLQEMENVTVNHNTSIQSGSIMEVENVTTGLVYQNNLHPHGSYGVASPAGIGNPALTTYFPNYIFLKNVIIGIDDYYQASWSSRYPANNFFPLDFSGVGFVDYTNPDVLQRNYRLTSTSPYHNQGTDGKDVGADFDALNAATCGVITGLLCATTPEGQTPYPGSNAPNLPTTLEVENFDNGGEGVAYHENFGNTSSGVYRSNPVESVDVQARSTASNGYAVFEASAGEWLEYTINASNAGIYDIDVAYASKFNNGKFHVEIDGIDVTGQMTANSTGNWRTFQTLSKTGVSISAGQHIVRLAFDSNSPNSCNCVVGNFDKIQFKTSTASSNVIWQDIQGTTSNGGTITHAGTYYYGKAKSQQVITAPGYFEWTHNGNEDVWVGLGIDGTITANTTQQDLPYSFSGSIREYNVWKEDGSPVAGDRLRIEITSNGTVNFKKNRQLVYTSLTPANGSYRLFFMVQAITGNGISNAAFGNN